jgi:SAM-dependent methyltransferase
MLPDFPLKKQLLKVPLVIPVYVFLRRLLSWPRYIADMINFIRHNDNRFPVKFRNLFPLFLDRTPTTGFEPHYIYHPAWAARVVARVNPEKHIDIASTLHFCTIASAFVPVEFYDYRPALLNLPNLTSKHGDLTNLHFESNSIQSLSCLHTVEHVGLGRYGDPIDPTGDIKAAKELARVLAPGGTFIFVTPVGKPKIAFNAHRIYSYEQVLALFPDLKVTEFSMVPDDYKERGLILNADPKEVPHQEWACGCFVFTK